MKEMVMAQVIVVLRTYDLAQTFERRFAPMCKGYRVLRPAKEIPK
jgi:hypothetical protein